MKERYDIVHSLSQQLLDSDFTIGIESRMVVDDAGVDAKGVAPADVEHVYYGTFEGQWRTVAFAFDEVLAQYCCIDVSLNEFVRGVFVAIVLSEAVRKGYWDWEYSFDKVCLLLFRNMDKGDCDFRMRLFSELLSTK